MSDPEKDQTEDVNPIHALEDRLLKAYVGQDFTIAIYKNEEIVFLNGKKGNQDVDIVMTVKGAAEMVETIQKSILESKKDEQSGELDSLAQP